MMAEEDKAWKEHRADVVKKLYYARKMLGLCVSHGCSNKSQPGKVSCEFHLDRKRRNDQLKRKMIKGSSYGF